MKVILVYRQEAQATPGVPHDLGPFDGVEVVGVANDDDDAMHQIDRIKEQVASSDGWKFHIDQI